MASSRRSITSRLIAFGVLVSVAGIGACARGADVDPSVDYLAAMAVDSGTTEEMESVPIPPSSKSSPDDDVTDAGADAGKVVDAGAADGGAGVVKLACAAPTPCGGATDLGAVSGDVGADTKSAEGDTSQWFTVRVTENDQALTGRQLWMTATLVSPPGTNFDLYLYLPGADTQECSAVSSQSKNTSSADTASVKFGEMSIVATVPLDDRTVTVEVRHVSGSCDPQKKWKLEIAGNR